MFGRSSTSTRTTPVREGDTVVEERTVDGRTDPAIAQEARRDKFGGLNSGAAFFGWLVAMAVAILLTSIVGAIAAAVGSNVQVTQSQARQQAGTIGLVAAIVLGAVFGQQYDILSRVNLPRLPISSSDLTTGGVIAALLVLGGTLVAALAGGSIGTHYHRRVDNTGYRA